jgi:hypothetical protein
VDAGEDSRTTSLPSFDDPHDAVQENGTYGGQGKAVGCVSPAALLFFAWPQQENTVPTRKIPSPDR